MKYDLKKPCRDCPFVKAREFPLHPGRVKKIGQMMLSSQGGPLPCHKTVDYDREDDEQDGRRIPGPNEQHCAGALAFALRNGNMTQMMRICARLGMFDPDQIEREVGPLVWRNLREWVRFARGQEPGARKAKRDPHGEVIEREGT